MTEGLEVARLFLGGGAPIVLTESKAMAAAPPRADGPPLTALPLTVLVNDHTASASEILAGALKDNCRAVLVGGRTYGKGLIQSVYELSDTSGLVITVGKYLTPGGVDIDRCTPRAAGARHPLRAGRRRGAARRPGPSLLATAPAGRRPPACVGPCQHAPPPAPPPLPRYGIEPDFRAAPPPAKAEEALAACRLARDGGGAPAAAAAARSGRPQELLVTGETRAGGGGGGARRR